MPLDLQSEANSMWLSVTLLGLSLSAGVGFAPSGLRSWIGALALQSIAWGALSLSLIYAQHQWLFSNFAACTLVASVSAMYMTAVHYLQQRAKKLWVFGPPMLALLLHATAFSTQGARLQLVNLVMGLQFALIASMLAPKRKGERPARWRWLALGAFSFSAVLILIPLILNFISPGVLARFPTSHWLDNLGLGINNGWPTVCTLAFLLAHRDEAEQALRRLATKDGLTGLLNRRSLMDHAETEVAFHLKTGQPCTLIMLDIDHFKKVNDSLGHQGGDLVLAKFSSFLRECVRPGDHVGRYGGEEFCVILKGATIESARALDFRLRMRISQMSRQEAMGGEFNFSAGAAQLVHGMETLSELIGKADSALYAAKNAGRGQMVVAN